MLSVIIPCFNDHVLLEHTLTSLRNQNDPGRFEIIVVDSSAKTYAYTGPLTVRYFHQPTRVHAGIARNIGAQAAQGDVLVFLDCKVVPESNAFKMIAGLPLENTIYSASLEISPLSTFWGQLKHRIFFHEFQYGRNGGEMRNLPGTFLVMAKETFFAHEGFGSLIRHQDTEYTERMKRHGCRLIFQPMLRCTLVNAEDARTLMMKVYLDGAGYVCGKGAGRVLLLPLVGIAKFLRIASRNIRWRHDFLSVVLFIPTVIMSFVWGAGGLSSALSATYASRVGSP